jgi:hypothetical protein
MTAVPKEWSLGLMRKTAIGSPFATRALAVGGGYLAQNRQVAMTMGH